MAHSFAQGLRPPALQAGCGSLTGLAYPLPRRWQHRRLQLQQHRQRELQHTQQARGQCWHKPVSVTCSSAPRVQELVGSGSYDGGDEASLPPEANSSIHHRQQQHLPANGGPAAISTAVGASEAASPPDAGQPQQQQSGQQAKQSKQQRLEQEQELEVLTTNLPATEARLETLITWVAAAAAFGGGLWYTEGAEKAQEYFAGYLLEQSLSVDNLFVFVLVFNYFKTPVELQGKVLSWGIGSAAVLRAVMILLGTELISQFRPLLAGFALILLWSAYGLVAAGDDDDEEDLTNNTVVKLCRRLLPVSESYEGPNFFTKDAATGAAVATPLLLTLAVIELSDVLFAVDSIPAVFGVTLDPVVVYSSNMFAILSLRSLYSFVATAMGELRFLDRSIALVLGFIGGKMLLELGGVDVPTDASLTVVGLLLGGGVAASMLFPEPKEAAAEGASEGEGSDKEQ